MSLKVKSILFVVLIILLIGIGTAFFAYYYGENVLVEREKKAMQELTQHSSHVVNIELEHSLDTVKKLVAYHDVIEFFEKGDKNYGDVSITKTLSAFNLGGKYSAIYLMDTSGETYASTDSSFVGKNYEFRSYFKDALAGGYGVNVLMGVTSKKLGYYFSAPVKNVRSEIIGVAVMKLDPDQIYSNLHFSHVAEDFDIMLVDEFEVVLFSTDESREFKSLDNVTSVDFRKIEEEKRYSSSNIEALNYEKLKRKLDILQNYGGTNINEPYYENGNLITYTKIDPFDFYLIFEKERSEIVKAVRDFTLYLGVMIMIGAGFAGFILVLLINHFMKPLDKMNKVVQSISKGKYNVFLDPIGLKELDVMAGAINKMAKNLDKNKAAAEKMVADRTAELQKVNDMMIGREMKMIELKKKLKEEE